MEDFSIIYVDLAKAPSSSIPSNERDSNGALICNNTTKHGSETQQLPYEEFVKYIKYRCDDRNKITFLFKNKVNIDTSDLQSHDTLWDIGHRSNIYMSNQIDGESAMFNITSSMVKIYVKLFNSNLTMSNLDFNTTQPVSLRFSCPNENETPNDQFNDIYIYNCRFWGHNGNHVYGVIRFEYVKTLIVAGSIFCVYDGGGSFIGMQLPINNGYSFYTAYFIANIMYNITDMYDLYPMGYKLDLIKRPKFAYWNIFTGTRSGYLDFVPDQVSTTMANFLQDMDISTNEFEWSGTPSICSESLGVYNDMGALQNQFNYLSDDWITASSMLPDPSYFPSNFKTYLDELPTYGTRDGRGALVFPTLPIPYISYTPKFLTINDVLTMDISNIDYENDYKTIYIYWAINGIFLGAGTPIQYTISDYGRIDIRLSVWSRNQFYYKSNTTSTYSLINIDDIDIDINTYNGNNNLTTTFDINETVKIEVVNKTDNIDNAINDVDIIISNEVLDTLSIPTYLDSSSTDTTFSYIGDVTIIAKVHTIDGRTKYFYKIITINDVIGNTYYVDLSQEYEDDKWLELNYGLYDDFENGYIGQGFASDFKFNYSVISMYDELVANGTKKALLVTGVLDGDFKIEWSFVRSSEDDDPHFFIDLKIDNVSNPIMVSWDFISDSLLVYDSDRRYRVKYDAHVKDLDCPNTIHKINIYANYDSYNGKLNMYYDLDAIDDTRVHFYFKQISSFDVMSIYFEGTNESGLGYIGVQANNVDQIAFGGEGNGSTEYPFTYQEMYDRISIDNNDGNYNDKYLCRNSRIVSNQSSFFINPIYNYRIDVWDPHKYGPWMLVFDINSDILFINTILSNGIIYNREYKNANLLITMIYDMFITWNGANNKIGIIRYPNKYVKDDIRADLIGSTIKSVGGFYSTYIGGQI